MQPKYLVTFTVGYDQKKNIDAAVKKVSNHPKAQAREGGFSAIALPLIICIPRQQNDLLFDDF